MSYVNDNNNKMNSFALASLPSLSEPLLVTRVRSRVRSWRSGLKELARLAPLTQATLNQPVRLSLAVAGCYWLPLAAGHCSAVGFTKGPAFYGTSSLLSGGCCQPSGLSQHLTTSAGD